MKDKKKNVTLYYGIITATYSVGYVTMSAFSSLFLKDIGLDDGDIGMLLAIASLVSVLIQPKVGSLIDRNPKISTKGVLLLLSIMVSILGISIVFLARSDIAVTTALYGISVMLLMLGQPFINALGMDAINYGYPINFGIGRGMGSLGYALGSAAFGSISVMYGPRSVPVAFSCSFLALCLFIYFYPVKKNVFIDNENKSASNNNSLKYAEDTDSINKSEKSQFLIRYKRLGIMLFGLIFVYFSHALINTFTLQIVQSKSGDSADMGTATAIAAICELVTVIIFPFYLKHFKLNNLLRISCVFFTLKIFTSFLVPDMMTFFLIQGLQMFGWGIMSIGIVYYANEFVGENDKAQAQAYAGMAYTISSVLASFLGGNIIDWVGVDSMLQIGSAVALIGTIVVWVTVKDLKVKTNEA